LKFFAGVEVPTVPSALRNLHLHPNARSHMGSRMLSIQLLSNSTIPATYTDWATGVHVLIDRLFHPGSSPAPAHTVADEVVSIFRSLEMWGFLSQEGDAKGKLRGNEPLHVWLNDIAFTQAYELLGERTSIHSREMLPPSTCFRSVLVGWSNLGYMTVANRKSWHPPPNPQTHLLRFRDHIWARYGIGGASSSPHQPHVTILEKHMKTAVHAAFISNVDEIEAKLVSMGSLSVGRATWKGMPMRKQVEVMANTDITITLPGGDVINAAFLPTKAALIVPYRFVNNVWGWESSDEVRLWFEFRPQLLIYTYNPAQDKSDRTCYNQSTGAHELDVGKLVRHVELALHQLAEAGAVWARGESAARERPGGAARTTRRLNDIMSATQDHGRVSGRTSSWGGNGISEGSSGKLFQAIAALADWCLVIVGDKKGPPASKYNLGNRTVYLSPADQEAMVEFQTGHLLQWNHFGRKNLGFLYAIHHGAQTVYDTDDDNELHSFHIPTFDSDRVGEVTSTHKLYNLYPQMSTSSASWPRGFPLDAIKDDRTSNATICWDAWAASRVAIVQSLADHDPDVDAIYRLTQHPLPFYFQRTQQQQATADQGVSTVSHIEQEASPHKTREKKNFYAVSMPAGTFMPYNAQATLHRHSAFWSMLLPGTVHGRVTDIWRGYLAQRLLWDIGMRVAFSTPWVSQYRNAHHHLADFNSEPVSTTLPGRLEEIYIFAYYEVGVLSLADVQLMQAWIGYLLMSIGYIFPEIKPSRRSGVMHRCQGGSRTKHQHSKEISRKKWETQSAITSDIRRRPASPVNEKNEVETQNNCSTTNVTRVLITGVSGMIGSHIARALLIHRPCATVYGLVRPRTDLSALHGVLQKIILLTGDLADGPRIRAVINQVKPHYLYHMAAQAINAISYMTADLTLDVNVRGTLNVLDAIKEALDTWGRTLATRVLIAGSSTEYGRAADLFEGQPLPETAPLLPVSPYGVSKVATEKLANMYFYAYGVQAITARFFIQVGVGGTDSLAIHQFCKQIAMAEAGLAPPTIWHGNLASSRDMTDAHDSAPVVIQLAERGKAGEAYNVGTGETMTVLDLLHLAIHFSRIPVKTKLDASRFRVYDEKVLVADIQKLSALTGWIPSTNMSYTVRKILSYWRRKVLSLYSSKAEID
ncbi:MAG: hypothetical protein SGPRY_012181, partial [Prymnesium sp.]